MVNTFIESFIAVFTGSVVKHKEELENETLMPVWKHHGINNS